MMAPRSCAAAIPRTSPTRSQSRMASVMEPIASGSRLTMYCSWPSASSMRARAADSSSPRSSASVRKATASVCEPARAASSAARAAYRLVRDRSCAASAWCVSTAWSLDRTRSSASSSRRCSPLSAPSGMEVRPLRRASSWRKPIPRRERTSSPVASSRRRQAASTPSSGRSRSSTPSGAVATSWSTSRSSSASSLVPASTASRTDAGSPLPAWRPISLT